MLEFTDDELEENGKIGDQLHEDLPASEKPDGRGQEINGQISETEPGERTKEGKDSTSELNRDTEEANTQPEDSQESKGTVEETKVDDVSFTHLV